MKLGRWCAIILYMVNVPCPREFDDVRVIRFLKNLEMVLQEIEVTIDFNHLFFVLPFGTLIAATGIRSFVRRRHKLGLVTIVSGAHHHRDAISYLRYIGFFPFIGIEAGNRPNEAPGSNRYLPITPISKDELQGSGLRIQDEIDKRSRQLAGVIFAGIHNETRRDMLGYCLRETIRNVFEHAGVEECVVMAQRWDNGNAEIAIVDEGRGLFASLSESHAIADQRTAISEAIKPGISRINDPCNDDRWQNSGFGLYVVSELGKKFGSFTIASDDNALLIADGENLWATFPINGTALKLSITIEDPDYFSNLIQAIVIEGEKEAGLLPGAIKKASKMSSTSV